MPESESAEERQCLEMLVATVRAASRTLDEMWRQAVASRDGSRLTQLGDASYGLHLALVALDDAEAERRALVA